MCETHEKGSWRHRARGRPRAASPGVGGSSGQGLPWVREPRAQSQSPTSRVPGLRKAQDREDPGPLQTPESPVVASGVREEGTGISGGPSGLAAAAAAAASGAAALYPHKAGLLLQNAAPHHLSQLLRRAPLVGGHLHPGAGQPPEHML